MLDRVVLPLSGVMLASAALGNVLADRLPWVRTLCFTCALFLFILLVASFVLRPNNLKTGLRNPVFACSFCTFPMGCIVFSTYVAHLNVTAALCLWWFGLIFDLVLVGYIFIAFILPRNIDNISPAFFIASAGYVIASVTAPLFHLEAVGYVLVIVGLIAFLASVPFVLYRLIAKPLPEAIQPLTCIFAAPFNLIIVGYLACTPTVNTMLLKPLVASAAVCYCYGFIQLVRLLHLPFYPSYAAFTFPFVISASATKTLSGYFAGCTLCHVVLAPLLVFQEVVAAFIVTYVFVRYLIFIFVKSTKGSAKRATSET